MTGAASPWRPIAGDLSLRRLTGRDPDLADHLDEVAWLRIDVFRHYPYLYLGTEGYEAEYLATYARCPESVVVLVRDGYQVVGASTGLPLEAETGEFREPFKQPSAPDPSTVFYCGESVLAAPYRGQGLYAHFFAEREAHARSLGRFEWMAFCAVDRPDDHPRRPARYVPLDPVWRHFGYTRHPDLTAWFSWKDLDDQTETPKPMTFWLKRLD